MLENSISLQSLLETHESPFVIIDASLTVVDLNKAWEQRFGLDKTKRIGLPCCDKSPNCRHHELFEKLEPYALSEIKDHDKQLRVRGYPLLDKDGTVYLGESIIQVTTINKHSFENRMIGSSNAFSSFKNKLTQAAQSLVPVLLLGETGTGKEVAAEFIHNQSKLNAQELVVVDCTVLTDDLFESELFGHEKGAFTGAANAKTGLFELANKGTLFLDEIGELPLSQQPKLLRALETGNVRRVGGTSSFKSDVRVICATHRNLAEMVKSGQFREDLYYRLSVFPIQIPALRERMQDIPTLTDHLLIQISQREGQNYSIDKSALIKLLKHQWPGNIRELKNCLQLASNLCKNGLITDEDINYVQKQDSGELDQAQVSLISDANKKTNPLVQMESEVIQELLKKHKGNRKLIASEMDISERTLYRKLKRFELN